MAAARAFEQAADGGTEVTLVTRTPWAPVKALLPAVAAGNLDPRLAVAPIRPLLRATRVVVAEVIGVDAVSRQVQLAGREVQAGLTPASLPYDDALLALGAAPAATAPALSFAGLDGALALRERLLRALEDASIEESPRKRKILTTVVILGDDLAACALAGELLHALRGATAHWPRLERDDPRVVLASPGAPLPQGPVALRDRVQGALASLGVEVLRDASCTHLAADHLILHRAGQDQRIEARLVLSTRSPEAPAALGSLRTAGLVEVEASLASGTFPGLWAAGSCAAGPGAAGLPEEHRARAYRAARNILARARGGALDPRDAPGVFRAFALAPGVAVGALGPLPLPPALAWRLWFLRELRRWWPGAGWLDALAPGAAPGLLASGATEVPDPYRTPFPPGVLPLPPALDDRTALGMPFTLPLPPPSVPRR